MANTTNFAVEKPTVGGYRNTWGGTINTGLDKLTELLALALPVGSIQMYPKTTAPTATSNGGTWLVCNGATLVQSNYPDLFSVIGVTYGNGGNASTHFQLPDLRSRVPVGYNVDTISGRSTRAIAVGSGAETHTLQNTEIPKHTHPVTDAGHVHPIADQTHTHTGSNSGGTSNATLSITDPKHSHTFMTYTEWSSGSGYGVAFDNGPEHGNVATSSEATGITIADHNHSFTTTANSANISTTQTNPSGRITTTNNQADGDGAHNIMQPYLVVNYIILAKHPTFS